MTELLWKTSWLLRRTKEITWHKKGEPESRQGDPEKTLAKSRHNGRGRLTFLPSAGKRQTKNRGGVTRYLRRQIALSATGKLQNLSRYIFVYCNCQVCNEKKNQELDRIKGKEKMGERENMQFSGSFDQQRQRRRGNGVTSCLPLFGDAKSYLPVCCCCCCSASSLLF